MSHLKEETKMNVSQNQMNNTSKHLKKRLSHDQVRLLEASFDAAKKLEPERKLKLASELGVPPRQIAIWYQNRRARWKNQSLELGYGSLQARLDAALAEKRRLEEEAQILRGEIKRARDMLVGCTWTRAQSQSQAHQACAPPVSSLSSFCDDGVNDDVANGGEVLPFEELYGCLMVSGGTRDPFLFK